MTALLHTTGAGQERGAGNRPLRIAMIAPPWFELPPSGYGGTEAVVAALVDQLSDRGHEIVLIGAGRHRTKAARFHASYDPPPSQRLWPAHFRPRMRRRSPRSRK